MRRLAVARHARAGLAFARQTHERRVAAGHSAREQGGTARGGRGAVRGRCGKLPTTRRANARSAARQERRVTPCAPSHRSSACAARHWHIWWTGNVRCPTGAPAPARPSGTSAARASSSPSATGSRTSAANARQTAAIIGGARICNGTRMSPGTDGGPAAQVAFTANSRTLGARATAGGQREHAEREKRQRPLSESHPSRTSTRVTREWRQ